LARRLPFGASAVITVPSCSPVMKSAMPAGAGQERALDTDAEVEVMLTDSTWTRATVRARCRDARGRRCVLLSWFAGPAAGRREGWFVCDTRLMRRTRKTREAP
jgi:hypothetical protein